MQRGEHTYTVAELGEEIKLFLGEAFRDVWVVGEVQRLRQSARGHVYFELTEKGVRDAIVGKLEAVIWRTDHLRVRRTLESAGQELAEGVRIRCRAAVDFYGPAGRLQLSVREVDPWFTVGDLARRRQEVLEDLARRDLLDRNRSLSLPRLPLSIGLVTSHDSAAYHDFLSSLASSGYGFRVLFVHAAVQGGSAEGEIASAFRLLAETEVDVVAVVRGGGARSDLAVFDSRRVAEAVARCPVPVLTGLGHAIDQAIADRVAHTALETPTRVAESLVARVAAEESRLVELNDRLAVSASRRVERAAALLVPVHLRLVAASGRLAEARSRLRESERLIGRLARNRVEREERALAATGQRIAERAPLPIRRRRMESERTAERLIRFSRRLLERHGERFSALERLTEGLSPQRTLERGFSITRRASGQVVRHPDQVQVGERMVTETAGGRLTSRVEER